jgi:hypothetical protein
VTRERTPSSLLNQLGVPAEFDLLSIDIDQNTYYVWEALHGHRPRVVAIEYNRRRFRPISIGRVVLLIRIVCGTAPSTSARVLKALERLGARARILARGLRSCRHERVLRSRRSPRGSLRGRPFTAENHYEPCPVTPCSRHEDIPAPSWILEDPERGFRSVPHDRFPCTLRPHHRRASSFSPTACGDGARSLPRDGLALRAPREHRGVAQARSGRRGDRLLQRSRPATSRSSS